MTVMPKQSRRASLRYIISGQVMFHTGSPDSSGELVNIGQHGMLVRTHVQVAQGTEFPIGVTVEGYPAPLLVKGQVVGASQNLLAVKFLQESPGIIQLLGWLSQENVPWTGLDTLQTDHVTLSLISAKAEQTPTQPQDEVRELDAILPFIEAIG